MELTLNTNIDSVNAQNNLNGSQSLLSQSLERLSSGLRINSAADDAAGLAISSQFTTQINGTNQAVRNANDAVSEAQTAGGALSTVVNNLQSIRTLAVESANGSNSASDRQALDAQVQQQISEISQIASQTSFNGLSVLNGSSGVTTYQVGANVGDTISIDLSQGVGATQIGQVASSAVQVGTAALTGNLTLAVGTGTAVTVGASVAGALPGQTVGSAYAKAAAINAADISGLTASASTTATEATAFSNIVAATNGTGAGNTGATASTYALSINGVNDLLRRRQRGRRFDPDGQQHCLADQPVLLAGRQCHGVCGGRQADPDGSGRQRHATSSRPHAGCGRRRHGRRWAAAARASTPAFRVASPVRVRSIQAP